jgi:hypothetical protein
VKVVEAFDNRQSVCWATTFTFDPGYFETFLLRRLGEPPINATVLVDQGRLAATWQRLDPGDTWRIRRANRDYLVRGIAWPGGAFHAKTVLLGNEKGGTLLVGSGNIGLAGLDHGREIYARFAWSKAADAGAFAAWRSWMQEIVARADDAQVRYRWADLLRRLAWLPTAEGATAFVTNARRPLLDQLADGIEAPVTRLLATAPFFDHNLHALSTAVDRFRPARVELRLGEGVSVDGATLRGFLEGLAVPWEVRAFLPRTYVHAKLIGIVRDSRARVLAGSANLSGPALLRDWDEPGANVEAGVIVEADANRALAWFEAGTGTEPLDVVALDNFALAPPAPEGSFPVRLVAASMGSDHRILLEVPASADVTGLALTDGRSTWPLDGVATTARVDLADRPLVWLADTAGAPRSNRVPLDDRAALNAILAVRVVSADRPNELDNDGAAHPLGQLLMDLYRSALFDVDETLAAKQASTLAGSDSSGGDALWDDFMRDQIKLDPRISRYDAWRASFHGMPPVDDFRWLIDQMLARAPSPGEFLLGDGSVIAAVTDAAPSSTAWEPRPRTLTSALNALKRWALALNDPRVRWLVAEYAPIDHYERLIATIWQIWSQGPSWPLAGPTLSRRLASLFHTLLDAFTRTERGYLSTVDGTERDRAVELLRTGRTPEIAAALAYVALARTPAAEFFAWQPTLVPALDFGVLAPGDGTADVVEQLLGGRPSTDVVLARLRFVATYTDDEHWSADVAASVGLTSVKVVPAHHPAFALGIVIKPEIDFVFDARTVRLLRRALAYKDLGSVRITSGDDVLTAAFAGSIFAKVAKRGWESRGRLTMEDIAELEHEGGSLASILFES